MIPPTPTPSLSLPPPETVYRSEKLALVICNFPLRRLSTFLSCAIFMGTAVGETWAVNRIWAAVMFLPKHMWQNHPEAHKHLFSSGLWMFTLGRCPEGRCADPRTLLPLNL